MTEFLFRDDPALQACDAVVTASADGAVELDRTVFYAASGGQPGDGGRLRLPSGEEVAIVDRFLAGGGNLLLAFDPVLKKEALTPTGFEAWLEEHGVVEAASATAW